MQQKVTFCFQDVRFLTCYGLLVLSFSCILRTSLDIVMRSYSNTFNFEVTILTNLVTKVTVILLPGCYQPCLDKNSIKHQDNYRYDL